MVQESVITDLRKYGFELISVHEPDLMATDHTRVLIRQMMGALAQYDKSQIVVRLRGARLRKKAQTGRCEGRKPYGYREGETAVIERVQALRSQGMSFNGIATQLNADQVTSRSGKPWSAWTVNQILSRPSVSAQNLR